VSRALQGPLSIKRAKGLVFGVSLCGRLAQAVDHRSRRAHAQTVGCLHDLKPLGRRDLGGTDSLPDLIHQDFGGAARYKHLSPNGILQEMVSCNETFYSVPHIFRRVFSSFRHGRKPWISLAGNLSYRGNLRRAAEAYASFKLRWGDRLVRQGIHLVGILPPEPD
jgi:hypothetical protein